MNFLTMKTFFCALFILLGLGSQSLFAQPGDRFPYVEQPPMVVGGENEMEWMTLHFWDNYDFSRAKEFYSSQVRHEGFAVFVQTLYYNPFEVAIEALDDMLNKAAATEEGYWDVLEVAENVLYDPMSPIRNDTLWEQVLFHAISSKSPLDEASKVRYLALHKLVSRNQAGRPSSDFVYTLANGKRARMHDIKSPYTLLYFYNPGCSSCAYAREQLLASGYIDELHRRGLIKVLALYPDGDVAEWRKNLSENPSWWITSYDDGMVINNKELYDLKAIPTFYLLDQEKNVILKDPSVEMLIEQLAYLCEM